MAVQVLINRRDLDFLLFEWLRIEEVLARPVFVEHTPETVASILDMSEEIATREFLPHYKKADAEEPRLTDGNVWVIPEIGHALRTAAGAGLFAAPFDENVGGLQLPEVVYSAAMAYFMAANVSTSAYMMLTAANARLLVRFGLSTQVDAFARPQIEGRYLGTMCLSETQAGSSLADVETRAVRDGEGVLGRRYRLFGKKMWISGGDHTLSENIVHLVLAKVPDVSGQLVSGTKGVSLFIVPKFLSALDGGTDEHNDIFVAGLNHKMGYRGIPNCVLHLGEGSTYQPSGRVGAVGYLIGEVGQGLPIMFHMMNEARVAVGLGAAMLAYRGYLRSVEYARHRPQGRPLGRAKGIATKPVSIIEHPDVKRMLLAQKAYAEGALSVVLYCARLADDERTAERASERAEAASLLGLLTPVAKTWPSEWGLAANHLAIQVYGGYGYARDYDVEQLYRDNRLNAIHEGTTGIQAIDLLGRKVLRDGGTALGILRRRIACSTVVAERHAALVSYSSQLKRLWDDIATLVAQLEALHDEARALQNATPFLSAFGHGVVGWLWLDQAILAVAAMESGAADADYYVGKVHACRFFFETELPRAMLEVAFVASLSDVAATMPVRAF